MSQTPVTLLLQRMGQGYHQAEHELLPLVYGELHRMAEIALRDERPGHTLQATALVNEPWLRFSGTEGLSWTDRAHSTARRAGSRRAPPGPRSRIRQTLASAPRSRRRAT